MGSAVPPRPSRLWELATTFDGRRFAGAKLGGSVFVYDIQAKKRIAAVRTDYDIGAQRLSIDPRGERVAVGSFCEGGITSYAVESGEVLFRRADIKRPQYVRYSADGNRLYCGRENSSLLVLDTETGTEIETLRSVWKVFSSPVEPIELLYRRQRRGGSPKHDLRTNDGRTIATIEGTTFAVLDVAFGPDRFCITESGGPVRCFDSGGGKELWRYVPRDAGKPNHVRPLGFHVRLNCFLAVEHTLRDGWSCGKLLRFDLKSSEPSVVSEPLCWLRSQGFCLQGERLLTSEGFWIDTETGVCNKPFRFPM